MESYQERTQLLDEQYGKLINEQLFNDEIL